MLKKILFVLFLFALTPTVVLAWGDCPMGKVLCDEKCPLFIDIDNDGICDYSQTAPEDRDIDITNTQRIELGSQIDVTEANNEENKGVYHLLPISLLLILLYSISHILSKKKIISIVNHRRIWNILLLITFLISGILGILLILRINFGWIVPLPFNILFWHVEVGIAMFAISIFHISWHWAYFKNILRTKKHLKS